MPPKKLTEQAAIEPRVVIGASGEGIASWGVRGSDPTTPGAAVSASVRPPGGQFGDARVISPTDASSVDLAANAAGAGAIAYRANGRIGVVFRGPLGDWSAPLELDTAVARLVVDAAGNTTILALEDERVDTPTETRKHVASHLKTRTRFADGTVGPWRKVATAYTITGQDMAVGGAGNMTVAWWQANEGSRDRQVFASTAPAGADFSEPRALHPAYAPIESTYVRVVANRLGDTIVAWGAALPDADPNPVLVANVLHSSFRPAGGEFGAVERVTVPDDQRKGMFRWDIALDELGNAVAAWPNTGRGGVAVRPPGGPWSSMRPLGDNPWEPRVTIDGKGTATIAYVDRGSSRPGDSSAQPRLMVRRRAREGSLDQPHQLATARHMYGLNAAADPLGNTILVWSNEERSSSSPDRTEHGVIAHVWDAQAPRVGDFALDPEGETADVAGVPLPEFDFSLSEGATVSLSVERSGRKPVRLARLKRRAARGRAALAIRSKLAKSLARAGSYQATIVARDSQGRRSKTRRLRFGPVER